MRTYASNLALQVIRCRALFVDFNYATAIRNAIARQPWSWPAKQTAADRALLEVETIIAGERG